VARPGGVAVLREGTRRKRRRDSLPKHDLAYAAITGKGVTFTNPAARTDRPMGSGMLGKLAARPPGAAFAGNGHEGPGRRLSKNGFHRRLV